MSRRSLNIGKKSLTVVKEYRHFYNEGYYDAYNNKPRLQTIDNIVFDPYNAGFDDALDAHDRLAPVFTFKEEFICKV
tara:strand:- start:156 stop:386 length:231 start_codon:yes stop_codon:yes gene_type:complete